MKKTLKIVHWLPKVIGILAILFVGLFALDSFDSNLTIWQQVGGFLIHLIPSFILTAILIIAWKREYIGGIIFTIIGLGMIPFVFIKNYNINNSIWMSLGVTLLVTFPFVVVGVLFMVSHFRKKRENL
ncbi:MAG: hypothetical protein Q8J84_06750 [Flavobacteriaceae bacterium]|nr:hypothetical protein [Flavobacteriaceae bacterium]